MSTPFSPSGHRVCIVAPEFIGPYPNGGVGTACYWEAMNVGAAGYDLTVLYTGHVAIETPEYWETHFNEVAPFTFVDVFRWAKATGADRELGVFEAHQPEERTSELVLKYLATHHFDLILLQEFQGHGLRALQARQSGSALQQSRMAVTLHGSRQWTCEGMRRLPTRPDVMVDFLERESTRLADRVIAPSRSMANWIMARWGATPPAVIPYCYDESVARPSGVVEHKGPFRHIVFFGRLETRKGVQLLTRALASSPLLQQAVDRVTFLGKHASIEGIPAQQWFEAELPALKDVMQTEVISDKGSLEALAWLKEQKNILVVSPSLGDNLPYAMIELYTNGIPFVTTRIGGIPDITGDENADMLAEATVEGLRSTLEQICGQQRLRIDYAHGYNAKTATKTHVDFIGDMLRTPRPKPADDATAGVRVVVVTDANESAAVATARLRCDRVPGLAAARWMSFADWRRERPEVPTLFLNSTVIPEPALLERGVRALSDPSADVATSFFWREPEDGSEKRRLIAPLGGAVEIGWHRNLFGGPCFFAKVSALPFIDEATQIGAFDPWVVYAAVAGGGLTITMVPEPLYTTPDDARAVTLARLEAVVRQYHERRPEALDLRWIFKAAYAAINGASIATTAPRAGSAADAPVPLSGKALYERFINVPDAELRGFAELEPSWADSDPFFRDFAMLRRRIAPLVARWNTTSPRVFVYGSGQHTRVLLAAFPSLGRFVAGFIDRRPDDRVLGKPCVRPEEFRDDMADVVLYSSREFELDMHERLKHARVEHVLLYHDSPAPPPANTVTRLGNRFGHGSVSSKGLDALEASRPAWVQGSIGKGDALFLFEMIQALAPRRVLELGVGAGGSSASLLYALDTLPEVDGGRVLHSVDTLDRCYFDDRYEAGEAARVMYPVPRTWWDLRLGCNALQLRTQLEPGSMDLAFIDALHVHPWPLIDLLHATELMKPGAWIVLHDIELPNISSTCTERGVLNLFEYWPGNKIHGVAESQNIGAVQLPDDVSALVPMALALLDLPWQYPVPSSYAALPAAFATVEKKLRKQAAEPGRARRRTPAVATR